jgi:hypothetical protein
MLSRTSFFGFVAQSSAALRPSAATWRVGASVLFLAMAVGCGSSTSTGTPDEDTGIGGSDTSGGTDTATPDGGTTCSGDQKLCGGACTSVQFDPNNCGACGKKCATGEVCSLGACKATCDAPLTKCGASCTDTKVDPNNCGTCGTKCVAGEVCSATGCGIVCPGTLTKCDKSCYDTKNDPKNCGACGKTCAAGEACTAGTCASTCPVPNKLCTKPDGTSICTNPDFDPNNCGACGVVCAVGTSCVGGGCGTPDKTDDDGDTISNFHEGKSDLADTDADGTKDYLDTDSDGDGITDAAEAGDTVVTTPPIDSDGDGIPNFRDTDSDNDGVLDKDEVTKGTDPTKADTDGDGYTDGEEIAAGTDPKLATSNPGTIGGFSFDLPYKGLPRTQELTFKPQIKKADVGFVTDTTGSMGGSITGIQTSLKSIVTKLTAKIPDVAVGVGDHRDMPTAGYGSSGDFPFKLWQRVTTNITDAQAGVGKYVAGGGADGPESQIEGLYQAAVGSGFKNKAGTTVWTPKFDPTVGFDATKGHGSIGGMGFRKDAQPIIILTTDISQHHAAGDLDNPNASGGFDYYAATDFGATDDTMPHTVKQTLDAYKLIGGKILGISVDNGTFTGGFSPRVQLEYWALKTGATQPSPDGVNCPTGVGGASVPRAMDDGTGKKVCPLVFSITSAAASGTIEDAIVNAITTFTSFVTFKTVWLEARDNTTTTIDETKFFVHGIPVSYATPLPAGCAAPSTADLLPLPAGSDGSFDSFINVCPGTNVTFALVLQNTTTAATCSDQIFSFKIVVIGDKTVETDSRIVTVRVPGDKTLCK